MLQYHLKIALRFFLRNKVFTLINISGLALGITAFLLLTRYVSFEKSYDQNLENAFRVTLESNYGEDFFATSAANHPAVGPAMVNEFPEVEQMARIVDTKLMNVRGILSYETDNGARALSNLKDYNFYFADGILLDIFNIPLLQGDPKTALDDPYDLIISARMAKQIFGNQDPVGKTLTINSDHEITVTGVFQDLPQNTHLNFDILMSLSSLDFPLETIWVWPEFYTYISLKPGTNPESLASKMSAFVDIHMNEIMTEHGFKARMGLQPVHEIHLTSHLSKEMSPSANKGSLHFLMIIALFVIGIAQINFINLSTSKSLERAREVGIKKVVGAKRYTLIYQFLCESLILNFVGVALSLVLISLAIKPFNNLAGAEILSLSIWLQPGFWIVIITIFLGGGLLAGLYPAFVLSGYKPITVLKGKFHKTIQGANMRKALVITQFAIALALISGTYIVYKQLYFMQNKELGFQADQNLVLNAPIDVDSNVLQKIKVFKEEISRNPFINSTTQSTDIPGKPLSTVDAIRNLGEEKTNSVPLKFMSVDHDFLKTYKIELVAGEDFSEEDQSTFFPLIENGDPRIHPVIINRSTAKALGYADPVEIIHKKIIFKYGPADRIGDVIGVMADYHHQSLQMGYENIMFIYPDDYSSNYLTINIDGHQIQPAINAIKNEYKKLFPHDPFNYFFLDMYFNQQYNAELKLGFICLLFSGLAIFIAALGLFGIGSHMALEKIKEISIRKVMGASTAQVLLIIPKKLLVLILLSGVLIIPVVYFLARNWLNGFAFHTPMNMWMFILPLLLVMAIALLSILSQSIKTTYVNPADSLRND
ncbi:ABC transporter permease [Membranihabitans maritimus]|uniref:ABC transporter permease n=1 Tax=Membranihabitans maritimus TaxID=2904244 RepID=UPI001F17916B|nr:ABC transporter permease [Membranihabitans maritimus]